MILAFSKALVFAKVESTPGVDAAPTMADATYLIPVMDPTFSIQDNTKRRNYARDDYSTPGARVGAISASLSMTVELSGAGSAVLPAWATLMKGCGMAGTSVVGGWRLNPATSSGSSLTLYVIYGTFLYKMTGCMGSFSIEGEAGGVATVSFTFQGTFANPTEYGTALPGFTTIVPPLVQNAGLTLNGGALKVAAFNVDAGNDVKLLASASSTTGYRGARIVSRAMTGGIDPEPETSNTMFANYRAEDKLAFSVQIGSVSGNRILITSGFSQITGIGFANRDGLRTFDLALAFCRGPAGNDEFSMLFD